MKSGRPLTSCVFAALLSFLVPMSTHGDDFFDPSYLNGDDQGSFRHHAERLIAGNFDSIEGLSNDLTLATWQELELRFINERLDASGDYRPGVKVLREFLNKNPNCHPLVVARARGQLAHYLWRTGDYSGSRQQLANLGMLTDWWLIGPFDNERGSGFSQAYGPEENIDLEASYAGKRSKVSWRRWTEGSHPDWAHTLPFRLEHHMAPNEEGLAYLLTHVHVAEAQEVAFRVGSSDAYAVWVNGEELTRVDVERSFRFDQDAVAVRLRAGWNRVLIKSGQTKNDWTFRARITAVDGGPIEGLRVSAVVDSAPGESIGQKTDSEVPLGASTWLATAKATGRNLQLLAWVTSRRSHFDLNEHPDRELYLQAIDAGSDSAVIQYFLAATYHRDITHTAEREENTWRQHMEKALELDPEFGRVRMELARYYLERFGNLTRAEKLIAPLVAAKFESTGFLELRARIIENQIGSEAATELREKRANALERELLAGLRVRKAREAGRHGDFEKAEQLLLDGLAYDATRYSLRDALRDLYLNQGKDDLASQQLDAMIAAFPEAGWSHMARVEYLADREQWESALEAIAAVIELSPDNEGYRRRRGDLLWHLDRRDAALAEYSEALRLEPNQPKLREYVEHLQSAGEGFEKEHRIPAVELIAAAFQASDESNDAARVLLDNQAVQIHQDGTTTRFHQHLAKITNDQGIRQYDYYPVQYAYGEQWVKILEAKVHHPDGSVEEAQINNRDPVKREGEYPMWSVAWVDLPPLEVGDVVEIEYRKEDLRQSFFGDYFGDQIVFADTLPRERTIYTVISPEARKLYYNQVGLDQEPAITEADGKKIWRWDVGSLGKVDPEPAMPPLYESLPHVEVSTFENWDAFATWYHHLIRKQFESSPEIKKKVEELTSGLDDDLAKIRAIYNFVVTDVRYIAWEFGVHGFKPYNASTVLTRRFGDCKDKATLICTMLDEVDIKAHPVLIYGTTNRAKEDFTLPLIRHFNHCIAYVPGVGEDGLFLDGTAEHHSANQLPLMDRGARVLVVKENGGDVTEIPWNRPDEYAIQEKVHVQVKPDGSAIVSQENKFTGNHAWRVRSGFEIEGQRKTRVERLFANRFPGTSVEQVETSALDDLDTPVWMKIRLNVPDYLEVTGEGVKLPPIRDLFDSTTGISRLTSRNERDFDLNLSNPRASELVLEIELPDGYRLGYVPEDTVLENPHANFKFETSVEGNRLKIRRTLSIDQARVDSGDYPDFKEFVSQLEKLRDERILLEKIEEVE